MVTSPDPGRAYETSLDPERRRRDGVHYTPRTVADELIGLAFAPHDLAHDIVVCDPTCGAGVFLLAAADALVGAGRTPADALASLRGMDIDPDAIDVARSELARWATENGAELGDLERVRLVVGDALTDPWPDDGTIDVVVGNPPFGGQLAGATVRDADSMAAAERILGRPSGYADTAGVFLVRALDAVRDGGSVVFVQPVSVLGARDASIVHDAVGSALESIWLPDRQLFDASVHVCAPVLRRGRAGAIRRWTDLAADAMGVPDIELHGAPLSTMADATAGFRHEFYEVAAAVRESDDADGISETRPRLVTVGLIDPAHLLWGERSATVAGVTYRRPVVDVDALTTSFALRGRPKVLVATQTRIIEAVADHDGSSWPSVPVISVLPRDDVDLDLLLAALLAPPVSVWAARRATGTARSIGAVRLTAAQVLQIPLPVDADLWRAGADHLHRHGRDRIEVAARLLTRAHGLDDDEVEAVMAWWVERSVRRRSS